MHKSKAPRNITHRECRCMVTTLEPFGTKTIVAIFSKGRYTHVSRFGLHCCVQSSILFVHEFFSHHIRLTHKISRTDHSQCQIPQAQYRSLASRRGFTLLKVQKTEKYTLSFCLQITKTLRPQVQIDVHDLSISIVSREAPPAKGATASKTKSSKPRTAGLEILSGAHLRIKGGGRYGFIGRNGSGKSSL